MRKRIIAAAVLLLAMAVALAGCGAVKQDAAAEEFRTVFNTLAMDGTTTVREMADYMEVIDKTIYYRLKKLGGEFVLERGVIRRAETESEDSSS